MLLGRLSVRRELSRITCSLKQTRCRSQVALETETIGRTGDLRLCAHREKKPPREPFCKNLFLGRFDVEFLAFPEVQTVYRHREFFDWLKPIEDYMNEKVLPKLSEIDLTSKVDDEIFNEFMKLGVFGAAVDEAYGGMGLDESEYAKLVEVVSVVPILGTWLIKRAAVVKCINEFATEQQKSDLLPKIVTGEVIPAICFSERSTGSVSEPLTGQALLSECRQFYTLDAKKNCVFDATRTNLFLVVLRNQWSDPYIKIESLNTFVVPKNTKGVTVGKPYAMLGQRGIDVCDVNFNAAEVPSGSILGDKVPDTEFFVATLSAGKQNVAAQAVGIVKRFLNLLTNRIRESDNFNARRHQDDSMHEVVGKIAARLYAMEAMTYLTTGMVDCFENQDTAIEKSLVHYYCTNACSQSILQGMSVLGTGGYFLDEPFQQIVRDSLVLNSYDRFAVDTKVLVALLGLRHSGMSIGKRVRKFRNPLMYPFEMIRLGLSITRNPKLRIDENLHPSLRTSAASLEQSVHTFKKCIEHCLVQYGMEVVRQRMHLGRMTDVLVEIYAMTAVLSRASRAYCVGSKNSLEELKVAMIFTYETYEKVQALSKQIIEGEWANGDIMIKDIADTMFQGKEYFAAHPLERTL